MFKSKDGLIEIYQGEGPDQIVYPPAAWSIINVPESGLDAQVFFKDLYHTATSRHIMLVVCRHKRKLRGQVNRNLPSDDWNYLETVSIWYEKPSTCSNNGFLPLAEPAWLYYKGDTPDTKKTEWFSSGDYNNATNLWNVAPSQGEPVDHIYYQKFSWELNLLLMSMAQSLEHKKFIYTLPLDKNEQISLFTFCQKFGVSAVLYAETHEEVDEILNHYAKFSEGR